MENDKDQTSEGPKPSKSTTHGVLICPPRDLRTESRLEITVAETLPELVKVIDSGAMIISIDNIRLVEMVVNYADMFDVTLGLLTGVPGADYSPAFDGITWGLDRTGYDALVLDFETAERMDQLKANEKPRKRDRNEPDNAYDTDVDKLKSYHKFDVVQRDDTEETEDENNGA